MSKLKIDLHPIYNNTRKIEDALKAGIEDAIDAKIKIVEIIPGKGSGQLKKRVLRFLQQKEIKKLYHRIDKDPKNHGHLWVRFKH